MASFPEALRERLSQRVHVARVVRRRRARRPKDEKRGENQKREREPEEREAKFAVFVEIEKSEDSEDEEKRSIRGETPKRKKLSLSQDIPHHCQTVKVKRSLRSPLSASALHTLANHHTWNLMA